MQILVVEDERRMADLLERTLHEEGHHVVLARDGRQGFDMARSSAFDVLMRNPGRANSRDTILESVWGFGSEVNENTLEVFVRLLRMKVDTREPKLIHTIRGFGYMMREP